jgi:hypothetical protein
MDATWEKRTTINDTDASLPRQLGIGRESFLETHVQDPSHEANFFIIFQAETVMVPWGVTDWPDVASWAISLMNWNAWRPLGTLRIFGVQPFHLNEQKHRDVIHKLKLEPSDADDEQVSLHGIFGRWVDGTDPQWTDIKGHRVQPNSMRHGAIRVEPIRAYSWFSVSRRSSDLIHLARHPHTRLTPL